MPVPELETEKFSLEDFNEDVSEVELRFYMTRLVQYIKAQQRDIETLKDNLDTLL